MTPRQAAKRIGCNISNVRYLIRQRKLPATPYEIPGGYYYDIPKRAVEAYVRRQPNKKRN